MCRAGYWGSLVLVSLLLRLMGMLRRPRKLIGRYAFLSVVSEGGVVLGLFSLLLPFMVTEGGPCSSLLREGVSPVRVLWCHTQDSATQQRCGEVAGSFQADVVVFVGGVPPDLSDIFPYKVGTPPVAALEGFVVYSRLKLADSPTTELGVDALPGAYVGLTNPQGGEVQLGMLALQDGWSEQHFARNKVSSRRLATLVRNSTEPRLVLGSRFGPPFSGLTELYSREARLRPACLTPSTCRGGGYFLARVMTALSPSSDMLFVSKGSTVRPVQPNETGANEAFALFDFFGS